jgi:hypothetical protein
MLIEIFSPIELLGRGRVLFAAFFSGCFLMGGVGVYVG